MCPGELTTSPGPLAGTTIVSVEQAVAAPLATCRLADAGARVIKVERPTGDFARAYDHAANGQSSYFAWINRNKESIALDLRDDADHAVLLRIIDEADVFVQNLAWGAAERLGLSAERLRATRPRLVVCDISGYGPEGPRAGAKAYDLLVQAESGLLSVSGPPGPLGRVGVSVVDIGTGLNAALAITQAVVRQRTDGVGAHVQVSLFDSIAEWMTVPLLHHDYLGAAPARVGLAHPSIAPYGAFVSADGESILLSVQSDREWQSLCTHLLGPVAAQDDRLTTNTGRVAHREITDKIVRMAVAHRSAAAVKDVLTRAHIAFGVVNDVAGLSGHPHLRRVEVPVDGGTVRIPAPPARTDWEHIGAVPRLDEHGDAIRAEFSP